ncbi:MAG: hypothetical protein AAF004_08310 [Pseudomonadota bacterium]
MTIMQSKLKRLALTKRLQETLDESKQLEASRTAEADRIQRFEAGFTDCKVALGDYALKVAPEVQVHYHAQLRDYASGIQMAERRAEKLDTVIAKSNTRIAAQFEHMQQLKQDFLQQQSRADRNNAQRRDAIERFYASPCGANDE